MKNIFANTLLGFGLLALTVTACKDKSDPAGQSQVQVRMTDAPGPFDAVYVDIQGIEIHSDVNGWNTIPVAHPGVYNLLELTNGIDTLLGTATLPSGNISQLRLILGPNNSVDLNGTIHELETPSAQQSGLKIQIHQTLQPGLNYIVLLDFDASKSIVETGSGKYILKPVIRAILELDGRIAGTLSPAMVAQVQAISTTGDTLGTYSDSLGGFMIKGLNTGTYQIDILPPSPYTPKTITGVAVIKGQTTQMGTIQIQ